MDMQIDALNVTYMAVVAALCTLGPIIAAFVVARKTHTGVMPVLFGGLVYIIAQLMLRTPFLSIILSAGTVSQFMDSHQIVYNLLLSSTSAIFEECSILIIFLFVLKRRWDSDDAIAYGVGHGGMEAFLTVGLGYINNFIASQAINTQVANDMGADISKALEEAVPTLMALTPTVMFMDVFEKVCMVCFHIAMTMIIVYGIKQHRIAHYLFIAIGCHFVLSLISSILLNMNNGQIISDIFIAAAAVGSLWYINYVRRREAPIPN